MVPRMLGYPGGREDFSSKTVLHPYVLCGAQSKFNRENVNSGVGNPLL